jgi:predicted nucleotidyltransferase
MVSPASTDGSTDDREHRQLLRAFADAVRAKVASDLERERIRAEELRCLILPAVAAGVERARSDGALSGAWVFGSYAWGEPTERSDVDLLVEGARDPDGVAAIVGEACGREVHVVRRERAAGSLVARVLAEGRAL